MEDEKGLVRINSRIGHTQNAWLDAESRRTGISKSGLIQLAVEQYMTQKQAFEAMDNMNSLVHRLEQIENQLQKLPKEK